MRVYLRKREDGERNDLVHYFDDDYSVLYPSEHARSWLCTETFDEALASGDLQGCSDLLWLT